jgi:hypothetical protein
MKIISGGQTGAEDQFDNLFLGQIEADIQVERSPTFPSGNPASRKPPHDPQEAPRHRGPAKWGLSL